MFWKMLLFTIAVVALMMIGLGVKMLFSKKQSAAGGSCCGSGNKNEGIGCACGSKLDDR